MAIAKGIEEGAALLKYSKIERYLEYNHQAKTSQYVNKEVYYVLKLYSRRARTNGSHLEYDWMKPFMEAISVRLAPGWVDYNTGRRYNVAVGTNYERVPSKTAWDAIQIDPIAQRHYERKINNLNLSNTILVKENSGMTSSKVQELRFIPKTNLEEEEVSWPPEPNIDKFYIYVVDEVHGRRVWR